MRREASGARRRRLPPRARRPDPACRWIRRRPVVL